MDIIKFNTTLKASGKDYSRIVFWNRFLRNPIELILSWTPAMVSIILLCMHYYSSFLLILYAVCWFYPIYIFCYQFRSSVNYHNKGRMIVMLNQKDMPEDVKAAVPAYIKSHVDRNICKINF